MSPRRARSRPGARRSAERPHALLDAARLITATGRDLGVVLDTLTDQARLLLSADAAAIDLADSPDELVGRRGNRLVEPRSGIGGPGFRYRAGGLVRQAFDTNRPAFARDYQADPRPDPTVKMERAKVASLLIVPLGTWDEPFGILSVEWTHRVDPVPADIELAVAFGAQAVAAIRTARLHDALRRSQERYRLVTEATPVAVWEWDLASDSVIWSGAGRALLGYEPGETTVSASWWHERVHPDERAPAIARAAAAIAAGADHLVTELRVQRQDGTYARVVTTLLRLFRDDGGTAVRALGTVQDVTILRAAEAEHDRLTQVVARAEERERVAMDLHDGVLGSLAGVAYHLAGLASSATLTREQVIAELGAAHRQVTAVADELRQYTVGLRTPDAEPIQVDLRALAAVARGAGVAVHVDVPEHMTGLRADALIDLLHVAREAVANTLRHAAAKHLSIRVIVDADQLSLQVSDDGIGFDEALLGDRRGHGLGNMAVRARRMGAVLTVTSTPGAGTDVRLTLSLDTTTHRSSSG